MSGRAQCSQVTTYPQSGHCRARANPLRFNKRITCSFFSRRSSMATLNRSESTPMYLLSFASVRISNTRVRGNLCPSALFSIRTRLYLPVLTLCRDSNDGISEMFIKRLYGENLKIRLRPHHFPFTEPSAEVDMECFNCGGKGCGRNKRAQYRKGCC